MKRKNINDFDEEVVQPWEVPEIDLNLRHYAGHPSNVIKKIKADIVEYVNKPGVPKEKIEIYSAIYHALNYYKDIIYMPAAEFKTGETFLSSTLKSINDDYKYLSDKYDSKNPTDPKVITFSGRIKSPISFMDKVREKITEYQTEGRDFRFFTESLRDIIGMRIIVDPPQDVKDKGKQAEIEYTYRVFYDLLDHRGINSFSSKTIDQYSFIPINSRYDPTKLDKMKTPHGFSPELLDENGDMLIYIPQKRIPEMDLPHVDSVIKDYIRHPKYSGYQSMHTCIIDNRANAVEKLPRGKGIIPQANLAYAMEYQCRTAEQHEIAERGVASHKASYKPTGTYHRLAIPYYLTPDDPTIATVDIDLQRLGSSKKISVRNFAESFTKYTGTSFETFFGISFRELRDNFNNEERNAIISRLLRVEKDEETGEFTLIDPASENISKNDVLDENSVFICLSKQEMTHLRHLMESGATQEALAKLMEVFHASDNMFRVQEIESEDGPVPTLPKRRIKSVKVAPLVKEGKSSPTKKKTQTKTTVAKTTKVAKTSAEAKPAKAEKDEKPKQATKTKSKTGKSTDDNSGDQR